MVNENNNSRDIPFAVATGSPTFKNQAASVAVSELSMSQAANSVDNEVRGPISQRASEGSPTFKGQTRPMADPDAFTFALRGSSAVAGTAESATQQDLPIVTAVAYPAGSIGEVGTVMGTLVTESTCRTNAEEAAPQWKPAETDKGQRNQTRCITFVVLLLMVVIGGAAVGAVCGMGYCESSRRVASFDQSEEPGLPVLVEDTTTSFSSFDNLGELYAAVDAYSENSSNLSDVAQKYGYPIGTWDVSRLSNFTEVFDGSRNPRLKFFNENLDGWDVSNATTFNRMFFQASRFSGNISTWKTGQVTTMRSMFHEAHNFNSDISGWDTSQVRSMTRMFSDCFEFNQNISSWNTLNLRDLAWMFFDARKFNQDLSKWRVGSVEDFSHAFKKAREFNQDLGSWNVLKGEDMVGMFNFAKSFNQDLSSWEVYNVRNMTALFFGAESFNQSLCAWGSRIRDVQITDIFDGSGCLDLDPIRNAETGNYASFCHPC